MNKKALLITSLIGGLVSVALSNIPIINFVNCLLCAGFWGGPLLAVWLYKRQAGTLTLGQAVLVGTVAGAWASLTGLILSLFGLAGAAALMQSYAQYLPPDAFKEGPPTGVASVLFNIAGVITDIVFGAIGGLVGGLLFKTKPTPPAASS